MTWRSVFVTLYSVKNNNRLSFHYLFHLIVFICFIVDVNPTNWSRERNERPVAPTTIVVAKALRCVEESAGTGTRRCPVVSQFIH